MDSRTWTNDDDGVFDPVEEQTQQQTGSEDNRQRTRCFNNDDDYFELCGHNKTGDGDESTDLRTFVRQSFAPKTQTPENPRAVRARPSSALSPPMQTDETTHPSTTPQLSHPGSFPPRKSVGTHTDSLGERRCGSYGTTRSSRGLSQAVTRPRLSSQGIPRPNPGPSRSPLRRAAR